MPSVFQACAADPVGLLHRTLPVRLLKQVTAVFPTITVRPAAALTAPPNGAAGKDRISRPLAADSTTSRRVLAVPGGRPGTVTPAVITRGQVRTDTICAPAPNPASELTHSGAPVLAR